MWYYAYLEEWADPAVKQEAPQIFHHQPGPGPAIDVQGKKTAPLRKGSATAPKQHEELQFKLLISIQIEHEMCGMLLKSAQVELCGTFTKP